MKIYLDMCCFNRPYDDQSQLKIALEAQAKLSIQNSIKDGSVILVGSYILDYENSRNPFEMRRQAISQFIQQNTSFYVSSENDNLISNLASEIMKSGVKEKDAYHVASAIYAECDYFISTDNRLLKYKSDKIKIVSPVEYITNKEDDE